MNGAFGGQIEPVSGGSSERPDPALLELFRASPRPPEDEPELAGERARAIVISFRARDETLEYDADLAAFAPLPLDGSLERDELLSALASVAERVALLHESGRIHGDVRPECIRRHADRTALLIPEVAVDPLQLLRVRLRSGACPADVAFAAPEVAEGVSASASSDVFALAAIVYRALTGRTPLGLSDARGSLDELPEETLELVARALSPDPLERPSARELGDVLRPGKVERRRKESVVSAVFVTGAVAVFTGFLGLSITRFGSLGELSKLAIAGALTLIVLGAGALLVRRQSPRSGIGLVTLGTQLFWADAYLCLTTLELEESLVAWTIAGLVLGATQAALAVRLSSAVLGWFAAAAFGVVALTLGLVLPSRDMGAAVYAAAVAVAYLVGARVLLARAATSVARPLGIVAGAALLASVGLSLPALRNLAPAAFAWPYLLGVLGLVAGSRPLAAGLVVLAPTLQALVLVDHRETTHVAAIVTLVLAAALGEKALPWVRVVLAAIAGIWALASTIAGLVFVVRGAEGSELAVFVALPYVLAFGHACVLRTEHRWVATVLGCTAPLAHALWYRDSLVPMALGLALGLGILRMRSSREWLVVGLALAAGLPLVLAVGTRGDWSRVLFLPLASTGIVALSLVRRASSGDRKALELSAVVVGVGAPFLLSLPSVVNDLGYSALALGSGTLLLVFALAKRRLFLGAASTALVLVLLGVQYFAKLSQAFHWGLLSLGLGLFLVTLAVLYERRLKAWLPRLGEWEEGE